MGLDTLKDHYSLKFDCSVTPLIAAAAMGLDTIVREILAKGVNVDERLDAICYEQSENGMFRYVVCPQKVPLHSFLQ